MKVRVISPFVDKNDITKRHIVGTELDISKERYEEIRKFVEIIKKNKNINSTETESQK